LIYFENIKVFFEKEKAYVKESKELRERLIKLEEENKGLMKNNERIKIEMDEIKKKYCRLLLEEIVISKVNKQILFSEEKNKKKALENVRYNDIISTDHDKVHNISILDNNCEEIQLDSNNPPQKSKEIKSRNKSKGIVKNIVLF
jgi:hypothetical protein